MRRRVVEMDGEKQAVSPLTMLQTEEALKPLEEKDKNPAGYRKWNLSVIVDGLNNARKDGEAEWTPDRVRSEIDPVLANAIEDAILEMTGLKTVRLEQPSPYSQGPGESQEQPSAYSQTPGEAQAATS